MLITWFHTFNCGRSSMTSWQATGPAEWRSGTYRITRFMLPSDVDRHYIWKGLHLLTSCLSMAEAQAWVDQNESGAVEARSVQGGGPGGLQALPDMQAVPVDPGPAREVPEVS